MKLKFLKFGKKTKDIAYQVTYISPEFKVKYHDIHWFCDSVDVLHNGMLALGKSSPDGFTVYFRDNVSDETIAKAKIELELFGLKLVPKTER